MESYTVKWTQTGRDLLTEIRAKNIKKRLLGESERLSRKPGEQGKALSGVLSGLRSIRVSGARYRIIYRVLEETKSVEVIAVGKRSAQDKDSDVYARTGRMARLD